MLLALCALRAAAQTQPGPPLNFNRANYRTGVSPYFVAVGDLNGDGIADLVVANAGTNYTGTTVSVLLGNGDGTFQPQMDFASGRQPRAVAIGDFNGDGKPDLAVANGILNAPGTVSVLLGNGDGTFQPPVAYVAGAIPSGVAVGDFNGDGNLDLAVVNFSDHTVSVLAGNGDGTFQTHVDYGTGYGPLGLVVRDFNGDGNPDLAVVTASGPNASLGSVSILLGNGDGTFQSQVNYQTGGGSSGIAVGDFNGDGKLDLAVANPCGRGFQCIAPYAPTTVSVLLGNGDGTFQKQVEYETGADTLSVAVADFNGDGKLDPAVANYFDFTVGVLLGNGDGTFQPQITFPGARRLGPAAIAAGHFAGNGPGSADIVGTNYSGASVSVFLNTAATRERLTASPNPVLQGKPVTLTVTVKAAISGSATPTGSVTFATGSGTLGTVSLAAGLASLTTSSLPAGEDRVTASYSGDANFNRNVAQVLVEVEP